MKTGNDLVKIVKKELAEEKETMAKSVIKQRIREIEEAEKALSESKKQFKTLLKKKVEDIADDLS